MNRSIIATLMFSVVLSGAATKDKAGEPLSTSRTIPYHKVDIPTINAQLNYSTMVVFDQREEIVNGTIGDADRWWLEHGPNDITIKPASSAARGAKTNVNVTMKNGHVYSFFVQEVSDIPDAHADLKLYVSAEGPDLLKDMDSKVYVAASEAEGYKRDLEKVRAELEQQKSVDREKIKDAQNSAPEKIRHNYTIEAKRKVKHQFGLKSMYTLNGFTYIEADPEEAPTVYEVKDGKPSVIQYTFKNGCYTIPKILDDGYLEIGKSTLRFKRLEKS